MLRYLEAAADEGIAELGFSEHVHRFRQALDVWRHPFWEQNAVDDLDEYVDFVLRMKQAGHPVKLGIELDYVPGREAQLAELLGDHPWDYVIGSVHFIADRAVDMDDYDAWRAACGRSGLGRVLHGARRSRRVGALRHPGPPGSGQGLGRRPPQPRQRPARLLRAGDRADRSRRRRDRAVDRRACASRSASSTRPSSCCSCSWTPRSRSRCPRMRTFPTRSGSATTRRSTAWSRLGVQEICVFEQRQRTMEKIG